MVVESPAKAKTINKYLGPDFEVKASMGHVRDLPSKGFNVDIENDFEPTYDIMPGKKRTISSLKAAAKKCDKLYLATDLDREGEAIAWHLAQLLKIPSDKTYRVIFNAITKNSIRQAFAEPGKLDMDKVLAQQARRILDRIVGYKISPLLWKKVAWGLSAGRVQSVAVKMVVEKEKAIRQFVPKEYWLIPAVLSTDMQNDYTQQWLDFMRTKNEKDKPPTLAEQAKWLIEHNAFKADLYRVDSKDFHASNREEAEFIFNALKEAQFKLADINTKQSVSRPPAPFITSTLQQAAAIRLGFTTKRTMRVAQQLYEGIDLGSMGSLGLITYMRTDSTHLSKEAVEEVRKYIGANLGPDYLPKETKIYTSKQNAQQAHEAIRPTDVDFAPSDIRQFLTDEQFKLYDLIWRRFVACQMESAVWDVTNLNIMAETSIGDCLYRTTGRVLVFDGFTKIWSITSTEQQLPPVQAGQPLRAVDISADQHFTKPPARYTEASLVKALEKEGVGRPSTYATIISTIQDRGYVEQTDKKFYATDLGEIVTEKLSEYFPRIMDIAFTRFMEEQLDKIEEQHLDWVKVLKEFYVPFEQNLDNAMAQMKHAKAEVTPSDYDCPQCGKKLVYRFGKNGKFLGCSAYPDCEFRCPCDKEGKMLEEKVSEYDCPECGNKLAYRFGKNGRFLSCSTYPDCKFACPCDKDGKMIEEKVSEHKCPNCGKPMVHKNGRFGAFLGCSGYPDCKTILKLDKEGNVLPPKPLAEPTGVKCYKCKDGELVIRQSKRGPFMGCNKFPRCRTIVSIKQLDHLKELQAEGKWPPETREEADKLLGRKKAKAKEKVVAPAKK